MLCIVWLVIYVHICTVKCTRRKLQGKGCEVYIYMCSIDQDRNGQTVSSYIYMNSSYIFSIYVTSYVHVLYS